MSLGSVKASTQDSTSGTPVAIATNENGSGNIQVFGQIGSKTTWGETSRTGLTTNDTGTTDLTTSGFGASGGLIDLENAISIEVRCACDTASKVLTGRAIFYDGSNNPLSFSETLSFTSDASLTIAGSGQKYPSQRQIIDVGQARKCRFYVDSITGTTWNVYVRPI